MKEMHQQLLVDENGLHCCKLNYGGFQRKVSFLHSLEVRATADKSQYKK